MIAHHRIGHTSESPLSPPGGWVGAPKNRFRFPPVFPDRQISLRGLFVLMTFAALCCVLGQSVGPGYGGLLFLSGVSLRTAVVDFSWRGNVALGLLLACGFVGWTLLIGSLLR